MNNRKGYNKQYYQKNRDKILKRAKKYQEENIKKVLKYQEEYYIDNKEKILEYHRQYRLNNLEKILEYKNKYYLNNKESILEKCKQYYSGNKEKTLKRGKEYRINHRKEILESKKIYRHKDKFREYINSRYRTDLKYNLNYKISNDMRRALKGNKNGRRWEDLVGYTLDDLIKHLQKTLPNGYTWDDVLNGKLHIDHKIPKSVFNFTEPEDYDFKRCWALSNLRLLPAKENLIKGNKLTKPFQPALYYTRK